VENDGQETNRQLQEAQELKRMCWEVMIREEVGWGLGAEMEVVGTGKIRRE